MDEDWPDSMRDRWARRMGYSPAVYEIGALGRRFYGLWPLRLLKAERDRGRYAAE